MGISNVIFLVLTAGVMGFFALNLKKNWQRITTTGKGSDEERTSNPANRLAFMLTGGLLQKRMFKEIVPGVMHFVIFWGFVTVTLGTVETILNGIFPAFDFSLILGEGSFYAIYLKSQDIGNFAVVCAISFAILRRIFFAPQRLKTVDKGARIDAFIVLGAILGLVSTTLMYMGGKVNLQAYPVVNLAFSDLLASVFGSGVETTTGWETYTSVTWWVHIAFLYGFITFLPYSKHQHLIWVWPNMFFKNSQRNSGRIRPMEFDENAESFGVGQVEEFTWKQLLDSMTCVECGRCTSVCPANSTGKKLDPRLMIHHLKDAMMEASEKPEGERRDLIGGVVSREELWDCTTCGACVDACPLHIEHIPAIIDMRRYMMMTEGEMPAELQTTMQNLEVHSNPWGISNEQRADWAKGLDVTTMAEKSDVDYLFWVGCAGSFDDRYKKVSQSIAKVMKNADVSFSILGTEEKCNGDTARRSGNEYLADMQIQENIDTMKRYGVKKVVTGCPHCFNTIKNEYPDFGFETEVIHHSELISDLVKTGKVKSKDTKKTAEEVAKVTYHDSCYLGRHNDVYDAPREAISKSSGAEIKEMPRTKENGFCCGAGGARMWMEETVGERINANRAKEAIGTGANTIATACPFCMTMMNDGVKEHGKEESVDVKDIAEIVASSID
jgi:Fe-S oxidoreductase